MRGAKEHPAGRKVPIWALASLHPTGPRQPKPVHGQTDIFDLPDQPGLRLWADGELDGQIDIFDVLGQPDEGDAHG